MSDDRVKKLDLVMYTNGRTTLTLFDSDNTHISIMRELSADDLESLSDACDEAAGLVRQINRERNFAEMVQRSEADE